MTSDEIWDECDRVSQELGADIYLHELKKAMGDDLLKDLTAYICQMYDIPTTLSVYTTLREKGEDR